MASTDNVLRGINHLLTGKEKCSFQVIQCRRGLIQCVVSSRLNQVTSFIAIAQLNFIKESTSYIHNTILGISNTTFT